jgi:hypothetical protein
MNNSIAKILLVFMALTLAVPESYAKRLGSGRTAGRQSQMAREQSRPYVPPRAPAAPVAPPAPARPPLQRPQPDMARQSLPPAMPQPPVRQASPWRGMLTGALVGLGLGSLMSHAGDRDVNRDVNNTNNAEGNSGTNGTGEAGTDVNAAQQAEPPRQNRFGSPLLWGLLALAAFFLVRRARRRPY